MKSEELARKTAHLKSLKADNRGLVDKIQLLEKKIEALSWELPSYEQEDAIEQLKQSIRIPLVQSAAVSHEEADKQELMEIDKKFEARQLDHLKQKRDLLIKIDQLRPGTLYLSHKRVLLKEYLESLRGQVQRQKAENEELQRTSMDLEQLRQKCQALEGQIKKIQENPA